MLEVSEKVLAAITRRDNPQMVVGVFAQRFLPLKDVRPAGGDVWVALDRVRDPGNLGTVIRTVDAVGAKGVILVGETTDPFSLETVRATMGSIFAVPVARATAEAFLAWRKGFPGLVAGTHLKGAVDYRSVDYAGRPVLLLMGNEQQGLPDDAGREPATGCCASRRPAAPIRSISRSRPASCCSRSGARTLKLRRGGA